MTSRLVIHFPNASVTFESDDTDKLSRLSNFCKKELGAYNATENISELTVDKMDEEMSDKFHSLAFELGLI